MSKTFWFSDENKNLVSKEFEHVDGRDIYLDAEGYAEDNGLHFFHPNVYQSREQVEKRAKEYGDTQYHTYDCPHLYCRDCKFFGKNCKRVDHDTVKMHKSPFASYHCGEFHVPCRDFELGHPEYADYREKWRGIEDIWPVYVDAWLGRKEPDGLLFHLGNDFGTDYKVPFELFFNGGMIEGGVLKAAEKWSVVKDKVDLGVQLYKIKKEPIGGVVIETGEALPVETAV